MLLGGRQESQEDEHLGEPDEEVEPGGDKIPPGAGSLRGAAQPDLPLVLVPLEPEDVTVEERRDQVRAEEREEASESNGVEEGQIECDAATRTPWLALAFVVEGVALPEEDNSSGETDHKGAHGAGEEAEKALSLGGGEDGGGAAGVDPAVDGDGEAEEASGEGGGEGDGDPDGAVDGGGETPVVEEPGPVEYGRDVSEAEEAVQHDELVYGGGRNFGHDHHDETDDDDDSEDAS